MKPKKIVIILLLLFVSVIVKAQYIQFSQYYATPTVLAPSFTGTVEKSRVNFSWRDQWPKITPSVFVTYAAGYDVNASKVNSGFGILMLRDVAGAGKLGRSEFDLLYSWYGLLDRRSQLYIRPGVQFKLTQRSVDFEDLVFGDMITVNGQSQATIQPYPENAKKTYMDAASSIMIYNPQFWAGINVDHLFRPSDAFYSNNQRVSLKTSVFGGYRFKIQGSKYGPRSANTIQDYLFLSFYYRLQGNSDQLDIGGYWEHEPFTLGVWVRGLPYMNIAGGPNIDAVIFSVGYQIFQFTIGYSYDLTVSPLLSQTGGANEISISYKFYTNLNSRKRDGAIPCPNL